MKKNGGGGRNWGNDSTAVEDNAAAAADMNSNWGNDASANNSDEIAEVEGSGWGANGSSAPEAEVMFVAVAYLVPCVRGCEFDVVGPFKGYCSVRGTADRPAFLENCDWRWVLLYFFPRFHDVFLRARVTIRLHGVFICTFCLKNSCIRYKVCNAKGTSR